MPRYYRRRYTRVVKNKKRWATNMIKASSSIQCTAQGAAAEITLVQNAAQSGVPTPVIVKTGNFKLQFEYQFASAGSGTTNGMQIAAYIVYVPELTGTLADYTASSNFLLAHPEYIMGMKLIDVGNVSGSTNVTTMSSRLKRNLNSGDKVCLIIQGKLADGSTAAVQGYINILGQYWTTTA